MKKTVLTMIILSYILWFTACGSADADHQPDIPASASGSQEYSADASIEIGMLKTNYETEPLCVEGTPLFSWQMTGQVQGAFQSAYRLFTASSEENLKQGNYLWDSGKILSGNSVAIPYTGNTLAPAADYYWTVQVWDQDGAQISTPPAAHFKTGLSDQNWHGAQWITADAFRQEPQQSFSGEISYTVYCPAGHTAFFWGADDSYYGSYYRLSMDTLQETPVLQFSVMHYEDAAEEFCFPVDTAASAAWKETAHRITLSLTDTAAAVAVDGEPAGNFALPEARPLYSYGFWNTRGAYYAYYDDLSIQTAGGDTVCREDFEQAADTVFSPWFCKTAVLPDKLLSGRCLLSESGFLITPDSMQPAPMFRKTFNIPAEKQLKSAMLYAGALGTYDFYINGIPADNTFFSPGQSQYDQEVFYRAADVTELIRSGDNALACMLGHGRYDRAKCRWGESLSLCALLTLQYTDGSSDTVPTDTSWLCFTDGPVRNDDMYAGEFYDAAKNVPHWNESGCDESSWDHASILSFEGKQKKPKLSAAVSPASKCVEILSPVSVTEPVPDTYVCDFGDNITGVCGLTFTGTPGTPAVLRYAENLNEENLLCADDVPGTVWTQGLFTARNTDYCMPSSGASETFLPRLVCRGFRYVQITGTDKPVEPDDIRAFVISADCARTGTFSCSDEKINRLYQAIYRTQKNNYVDIPTDCPQRDERFGWAGDAQVFAHTADYNNDTHNFIRSYLHTFMLAQRESGAFPDLLTSSYEGGGSNGWADAGIILTWELYQQFGDASVITEHLDAMCRYMDYLVETSQDHIRSMDSYSDHNAEALMADDMCNTLQCAYAADLLSKMCSAAGRPGLAEKYERIFGQYKKAWQNAFLNEDGSVGGWLQSEYVLPLAFGLYPEHLEETGAANLNLSVESSLFHVDTGYIATPWLLPVLCKYGYTESAYALIRQDTYPSWNYMFSHGNTTLTESFHTYSDGDDGTYTIIGSLNHAALGSVGQWLYSDVLGIQRDEDHPGFKHFRLEPRITQSLSYAEGSYDSVYGTIQSHWWLEDDTLSYECTVPPNTTATLTLPAEGFEAVELSAGHHIFSRLSVTLPSPPDS